MTVDEYNQSVDVYADRLYRFILKNIRDEDKANDIVQDTFEKLWLKVDQVDCNKARSYLFTTGYHTMIDMLRKEKKQTRVEDYHFNGYSTNSQYTDLQEVLHEAVQRLPEDQRSVILLRDYEGYAYNEIAEITGLSESQVKVYIYRGRMQLKEYLVSIQTVL